MKRSFAPKTLALESLALSLTLLAGCAAAPIDDDVESTNDEAISVVVPPDPGTVSHPGYITPWADPGGTACMDVFGGASTPTAAVGLWSCHGGANQTWKLTRSGQIVGLDNMCLDVPHGNTAPGTQLQLFPCNGGTNQQWDLKWDHTIRTPGGMCLSMPPGGNIYANPNQGMRLEIDSCNGSANQKWMVRSLGLITSAIGKCLEVAGGATANGTAVDWATCNGTPSQQWTMTPGGLVVGLAGKCLQVTNGVSGAVSIADCVGNARQLWTGGSNTLLKSGIAGQCLSLANVTAVTASCSLPIGTRWVYAQPLTVPALQQEEDQWCWVASTKMTLDYLGLLKPQPSQCQLLSRHELVAEKYDVDCCGPNTVCHHGGGFADLFNSWGYGSQCNDAGPVDFATLQAELANGRPVPFSIIWNTSQLHHDMVVVGAYTDITGAAYVIVNDPAIGRERIYSYTEWSNTDPMKYSYTLHRQLTDVHASGTTCGG